MEENFSRVQVDAGARRADHDHAATNFDVVLDNIMTDQYSPLQFQSCK